MNYQKNKGRKLHQKEYLGINLTKKVKDLYSENYKMLIKETENDTEKWRDIKCSWICNLKTPKKEIARRVYFTKEFCQIL